MTADGIRQRANLWETPSAYRLRWQITGSADRRRDFAVQKIPNRGSRESREGAKSEKSKERGAWSRE